MKKVSLALWCGLVIGLAAGSSPADILMDDDTQVAANELDTVLHLSKFDTSLGTLTGVWVQIELRLKNAEIEMDNDASQAQNGTRLARRIWPMRAAPVSASTMKGSAAWKNSLAAISPRGSSATVSVRTILRRTERT